MDAVPLRAPRPRTLELRPQDSNSLSWVPPRPSTIVGIVARVAVRREMLGYTTVDVVNKITPADMPTWLLQGPARGITRKRVSADAPDGDRFSRTTP